MNLDSPLIVAEIGNAHDGSLGNAHAYIDAVADAGAKAIKFQCHIAEAESHPSEPWRVQFSYEDETRYDYWKRMEFEPLEWVGLYNHAKKRDLVFIVSPFSLEAVEMLEVAGADVYKIASGEVTNIPLIEACAKTGRPMIISSGMSTMEELREAGRIQALDGNSPYFLHCTSKYPVEPEEWGLNLIDPYAYQEVAFVGLSDHSGTVYAGLAAVALGAMIVEVHVVFSKDVFGPDTASSITIDQLAALVDGASQIHRSLANPVDKDKVAKELAPMRQLFGKKLIAAHDMPAGHIVNLADFVARKADGGYPLNTVDSVVGMQVASDIKQGDVMMEFKAAPGEEKAFGVTD
jgi:N,N'-diacetyllegionaminate synthase